MGANEWSACQPASEAAVQPAAAPAPDSAAGAFARILVPIDGSEAAARALAAAVRLARRDGAALALLAIVDLRLTYASEAGIPPADLVNSLRREARSFLLSGSLALPPDLHADELLREGEPAQEIVAAARAWRADLIVLGQTAPAGLGRLLADHTTDAVARRAPCPVLVVQAEPPAPGSPGGRDRRRLPATPTVCRRDGARRRRDHPANHDHRDNDGAATARPATTMKGYR
jgi:nucleotide-binding universal stress UspA family protein